MSSRVCKQCGCNDIDVDPARGDAVCTNCGSVLEDQIIVSEVQFEENSKGGANVIGQFVSSEGSKTPSLGSGFHAGVGKESRAITLQNGKKRIEEVGRQLKLNQHCIDMAFNFFKMAVTRRLTRGRRTAHVVAACLYLVCRTEGTAHMLLDFSDVLQINVYVLGKTYLSLSKELCINIPALDPCLYIHRFAHRLEFGEKTHEVSMTALRLVSRMKRDWMAQGRRPSGLCGAALLVAGRMHNFSRHLKEMIKVVRVSETTIRKRLNEFGDTPSSQLTIEEFNNIDLEEESDPPSFTEGKRKSKLQFENDDDEMEELSTEISDIQEEIERALEESRAKRKGPYAKYSKDKSKDTSEDSLDLSLGSDLLDSELDAIKDKLDIIENPNTPDCNTNTSTCAEEQDVKCNLDSSGELSLNDKTLNGDTRDVEVQKLEKSELDSLLMPPPWVTEGVASTSTIQRPTAASLGLTYTVEECLKTGETVEPVAEDDGELDLTGIDDEELDHFLLDEKEVQMKTKLWLMLNADYLKEQKEKAERLEKEKESGNYKEKKKRKFKKKAPVQASTAGEAIEKMLQERKISSKINYDVLKDLRKQETTPTRPSKEESILGNITEVKPVILKSSPRFRKLSVSSDSEAPAPKKPKLSVAPNTPAAAAVVVESGPIDYSKEEGVVEDEADDYYEEEEEEEHISAATLLGHGVEEDDAYDDYND